VLFLEHKRLYSFKEESRDATPLPLGRARIVRPGNDITIASVMRGVHDALAAAESLAADGIAAEVIDLRTLRPLDVACVLGSLERTGRLLAVEEGPRTGGWAAGLVGTVAEEGLETIDDVAVLCTDDTPIPYSPTLEDAFLPGAERIAQTVRARFGVAVETRA
jgi:pyruvate/2-oxoglutarate/acetoin dehydrogenase E1 component